MPAIPILLKYKRRISLSCHKFKIKFPTISHSKSFVMNGKRLEKEGLLYSTSMYITRSITFSIQVFLWNDIKRLVEYKYLYFLSPL